MKVEWFRHDIEAVFDQKVQKLLEKCGIAGYGVYWTVVEKMYSNGGFVSSSDISLLERVTLTSHKTFKKALDALCEVELLTLEGDEYRAGRVSEEIGRIKNLSEKRSSSARKRQEKQDANAQQMLSKCTANAQQTECKCTANAQQVSIYDKTRQDKTRERDKNTDRTSSPIGSESLSVCPLSNSPRGESETQTQTHTDPYPSEEDLVALARKPLQDAFRRYVRNRGAMHKPVGTAGNARLLLDWLETHCSSDGERVQCLDNATMSSYQGLFPPDGRKDGKREWKAPDVRDDYEIGFGNLVKG